MLVSRVQVEHRAKRRMTGDTRESLLSTHAGAPYWQGEADRKVQEEKTEGGRGGNSSFLCPQGDVAQHDTCGTDIQTWMGETMG